MQNFVRKESVSHMQIKEEHELPLLQFEPWQSLKGIRHGFTTRMGGVSRGIFSSLNVSFTRGDEKEAVMENYRRIAKCFHTTPECFVATDQTHTNHVRIVTKKDAGKGIVRERDYSDVDGLVTNEKGLVLSAYFADCVPLFFYDPEKKVIALSHSGWKGTVQKIGQETIKTMEKEFGCRKEDIYAAIGPSICQDCYEVSLDVAEKFQKIFSGDQVNEILYQKTEEKFQLNLWRANEQILLDAGILKEHLTITDLCTCCNPELLFSHRASKGKRGNLGAFLMLSQ